MKFSFYKIFLFILAICLKVEIDASNVDDMSEFLKMYKMIKTHFMTLDNVSNNNYNKFKRIDSLIKKGKKIIKDDMVFYNDTKLQIEHSSILNTLFYCIIEKSSFLEDNKNQDLLYDSEIIRNCLLSGFYNKNKLLTRITSVKTQLGSIFTALNFLQRHDINKQIQKMETLKENVNIEEIEAIFNILAQNEKDFIKLFSDNDTKRRYGISDYNIYIELAENILKRKKTNKIIFFVLGVLVTILAFIVCFILKYPVEKEFEHKYKNGCTLWGAMNEMGGILRFFGIGILLFSSIGSLFVTLYVLKNLIAPSNFYKTLSSKFNSIKGYVESMEKIYNFIKNDKKLWIVFCDNFKNCKKLFDDKKTLTLEQLEMMRLLKVIPYNWNYWKEWFSARARYFCRFFLFFEKNKTLFVESMQEIASFESYVGVSILLKNKESFVNKWNIVNVLKKGSPCLVLKKVWAPIIDRKMAVSNDFFWGENINDEKTKMAIIYGMNAGGKTTLIQAIICSLLLAHVYGIAPAEECSLTPFDKIFVVIDVTTDVEKNQSKFMSELIVCDKIIEKNKHLSDSKFGFLICDELFGGTNPKDSNLFATNFIKHIAANKNIVGIYATHDEKITTLEKDYPNFYFANYHMKVKDDINDLKYFYKVEKGIVKQQIAIALAADMGRRGLLKNADILLGIK